MVAVVVIGGPLVSDVLLHWSAITVEAAAV
jgi:hypothetical protein